MYLIETTPEIAQAAGVSDALDAMNTEMRNTLQRTYVTQYRSRYVINRTTIAQAFSWLSIRKQELTTNRYAINISLNYKMLPEITEDPPEERAAQIATDICTSACAPAPTPVAPFITPRNIITISISIYNTNTRKQEYAATKKYIDEHTDIATKLTGTAAATMDVYHSVSAYKKTMQPDPTVIEYVVFTNKMSDEFIFKLSGLIHNNLFPDLTTDVPITEAIMSGNALRMAKIYKPIMETAINAAAEQEKQRIAVEKEYIRQKHLEQLELSTAALLSKKDIAALERTLISYRNEYATRVQSAAQYYRDKVESAEKELFIEQNGTVTYDEEALKQYLMNNKDLIMLRKHGSSSVKITVHGKLLYWNEAQIKTLVANEHSSINANFRGTKELELFKDILVNKKYTVHFVEEVSLDLLNRSISCAKFSTVAYNVESFPSNPHHWCYNCWGEYTSIIAKALSEKKPFQDVLALIQSAVCSLNSTDISVLKEFIRHVLSPTSQFTWGAFLEDNETGEMITTAEHYRRYTNAQD